METPDDHTPNDVPPSEDSRRGALLLTAAGVVATVVVVGGIAYVVHSTGTDVKVMERVLGRGRALGRHVPAVLVEAERATAVGGGGGASAPPAEELARTVVRAHSKMQAVGKNWADHRPIDIGEYARRAV